MARPSLSIDTGTSMFPEGNTLMLAVTTMLSVFLLQFIMIIVFPSIKRLNFCSSYMVHFTA